MSPSHNRLLLLLALLSTLALSRLAQAADPNKPNGNGNGNGNTAGNEKTAVKPDRPPKDGGDTGTSGNGNGNGNGNGSGSDKKSSEADLKSQFKAEASALQKKQKDLLDQLKNADADERAKIREQLVILKENWKELNREYRDKLDDLRDKADRDSSTGSRAGGRPRK
jgi:opacity protein-like surface antigen